jgi:hypothetical protein
MPGSLSAPLVIFCFYSYGKKRLGLFASLMIPKEWGVKSEMPGSLSAPLVIFCFYSYAQA